MTLAMLARAHGSLGVSDKQIDGLMQALEVQDGQPNVQVRSVAKTLAAVGRAHLCVAVLTQHLHAWSGP